MTEVPFPPELERELARWPAGDVEDLARAWHLATDALADARPSGVPSSAEAWADLERRTAPVHLPAYAVRPADRAPRRPSGRGARRGMPRWADPLAACVFVLAVVFGAGTWWARGSVTVDAPRGAPTRVALADGSSVVLSGGSQLTYARGVGAPRPWRLATRTVELEGEAFFAVTRDERRVFVVRTFNADVAVLGTRFNVRAWRAERGAATRVTVESGRVRVTARGPMALPAPDAAAPAPGAVLLAPGQATAVAEGVAAPATSAVLARVTAWRAGGFAVEGLPLGDVLGEVARRFGADVRAGRGVPLDLPMTLYYRDGVTADEVLHDLALAANLRYRPLRGGFEVNPSEEETP